MSLMPVRADVMGPSHRPMSRVQPVTVARAGWREEGESVGVDVSNAQWMCEASGKRHQHVWAGLQMPKRANAEGIKKLASGCALMVCDGG